ncbi:hypothetical protein FC26_GL000974 [Paucilactobacillus vaccinostercus DSM 20634]|uniref:Uncharacterized protein n=1 Tax=Paucilactobacillus vaccinostercus DSM 20634 TaxID=1423813 RepID=A0A0R2A0R6_9LACO|nr:hypothetical protein [Paucilactobacillus vaccinostercus]KRM60255.1 hypothetical protein FC26_GL000974 [Paucilactobacillus vaccinostercus DSM 20634]
MLLLIANYLTAQLFTNAWLNVGGLFGIVLVGRLGWVYVGHDWQTEFAETKGLISNVRYLVVSTLQKRSA